MQQVRNGGVHIGLYFLLDETGSMEPKASETVDAFNGYFEALKKDGSGAVYHCSLARFESTKGVRWLSRGVLLENVPLLTDYLPMGGTPLFDSIAEVIQAAERDESDKILIIIQTDGYENASTKVTEPAVLKALVEEKRRQGWEFVFMGCDIDAFQTGAALGISAGATISYSQDQTAAVFASTAASTAVYTATGNFIFSDNPALVNTTGEDIMKSAGKAKRSGRRNAGKTVS